MSHELETLRFAAAPDLMIKASADGVIQGYASTFDGEPDRHFDIIAPGAFTATLADHKAAGTTPVLLWSHDQSEVIGKWTRLTEDGKGLHVEGRLNLKTSRGRDAFEHVAAGDASGLSIGFQIPQGGQEFRRDGTTLIKSVILHEISIVALPANGNARITTVKSDFATKGEFADWLRERGVPKVAAARLASGGVPALRGDSIDHQKALTELASILDRGAATLRSI